jgi:hypothetical protein
MQLGGNADFLHFIWIHVSELMQFLTEDQKQHVSVCELCQIASNDATFLFRVITGEESWIYSHDPETKQTILPMEKSKLTREQSREHAHHFL